jgi:hypothetical protein
MGHAIGTQRAQLAVDIGRRRRQRLQRLDADAVLLRPIEAGAGQQLGLSAGEPGVHAVAVLLDLVQPVRARRRFVNFSISEYT